MSDANQEPKSQDQSETRTKKSKGSPFARFTFNFVLYFLIGVAVLTALGLGGK